MSDTEFELFVMNAGPDILRFCRIITNNKEQGDELYQDAMVLLLEKRASLKAEQNSKSYALSVAVLLWKNKKKKYANRKCRVRNRQHVQLPSPTQVGDTITLEIDGREIDIEVETVPDVYENYLRKQG